MTNRGAQVATALVVIAAALIAYLVFGRSAAQPVQVTFAADGQTLSANSFFAAGDQLQAKFSTRMDPKSVTISVNGSRLPDPAWTSSDTVAAVQLTKAQPSASLTVTVAGKASNGTSLPNNASIQLRAVPLEPGNTAAGAEPYRPADPLEITIENAPEARPQSGLQQADLVFEYLSEYGITRMTAIYLNRLPNTNIGPVRSCRPVNLFLPFAFNGVGLCSGASAGTEHLLFRKPLTPMLQDPFAPRYFFRTNTNVVPHNLYTSGSLATQARHQWPQPPAGYFVDRVHADSPAGTAAAPPVVALHHVSYRYDAVTRTYLRSDEGQPFVDASTGKQLSVKNVILVTTGYRILNYVEDEYGGARSVWYEMAGSGPADIYMDGRVIAATWHMCPGAAIWSQCNSPIYFTDGTGGVVRLDDGLTWIHVLGRNQDPNS